MEPRLILINLLVKLGVAAAVSSSLVRSKEFKFLLYREERTFRQKVFLVLWFASPIMGGVWIRQCAKVRILMPVCFATCFGLNSNILNAYYCNMSQESNTISFVFFQFVLLPMLIDH